MSKGNTYDENGACVVCGHVPSADIHCDCYKTQALRAENARLREALVAIQKSCKAQDEYSSWLLGITEAALQPKRDNHE